MVFYLITYLVHVAKHIAFGSPISGHSLTTLNHLSNKCMGSFTSILSSKNAVFSSLYFFRNPKNNGNYLYFMN